MDFSSVLIVAPIAVGVSGSLPVAVGVSGSLISCTDKEEAEPSCNLVPDDCDEQSTSSSPL